MPDIATNIEGGAKDALTALFNAFSQSPGVSKFMFPETGTLASEVAQFAKLDASAADKVLEYQGNIASTLNATNYDFDTFLAFANTTIFSNPPVNIQFLSGDALQTMYTFVISQAMRANNIAVASGPIGDPSQVSQGVDGDVFFDLGSKLGYSMNKLDDIHGNWTKVMHDVFSKKLTSPELLFLGAADCNNGADTASPLTFTPDNPTVGKAKCVSSAQYCMFEPNDINPGKEFTNCKTQNTFGTNDCKGSDGTTESVLVPVGYLGAYDNGQRNLCSG